jgi:hypothetical protein
LAEATPSSWGFQSFTRKPLGSLVIHKAKTEEPKTVLQQCQTGLTGGSNRSDRCATTQSGILEAEDTRRDRKACVEAKQVVVVGHPSDGENLKTSITALKGLVSLVVK